MTGDNEPAADSVGENPFDPPQSADPPLRRLSPGRSALRFVLWTLLGVVLVPPAAAICGFCCCTVGLVTAQGPRGGDAAFSVYFPVGALLGAGLAIALVIWLARRTRRSIDAAP